MMLIDANLLVYSKINSFKQHESTKAWLLNLLNSNERCGIPWESITAFIRITTNSRIFEYPLAVDEAWEQVKDWLGCENVWVPRPSEDHVNYLEEVMPLCKGNSGLIHDAHLVAIARAHGLIIYSADADFSRFPKVKWQNPIGN